MERHTHNSIGFCFDKFVSEWCVFLVYSERGIYRTNGPILMVPGGTNRELEYADETSDDTLYREFGEEVSKEAWIEEHIRFLKEPLYGHTKYSYLITKASGLPGQNDVTRNPEYNEKGVLTDMLVGKWYPVRYVLGSNCLKRTQRKPLEMALDVMAEENQEFREDRKGFLAKAV